MFGLLLFSAHVYGRSQLAATTSYVLHTIDISSMYQVSTYLHRLINVVCECPPRQDMQALAGIMWLAHICVDGTYYLTYHAI